MHTTPLKSLGVQVLYKRDYYYTHTQLAPLKNKTTMKDVKTMARTAYVLFWIHRQPASENH